MPEYTANMGQPETEPLTYEKLIELLYSLKRPQGTIDEDNHRIQVCDWAKIQEHGIKLGYDFFSNQLLTSSSEMQRALKVGAIWYEDENGYRIEEADHA